MSENKMEFFETQDGRLLYRNPDGELFQLDFDNPEVYKRTLSVPPTNKNKSIASESQMANPQEDMTEEQYQDYWKETSETKMDTSTAMMETRISKCMETTGKSREECAKEVKARMKQNESENINTEDMESEETKKPEKTEICPKELDMLRKKAKEYDALMEENKTLRTDMTSLSERVKKIEAIEQAKKEDNRLNKIKQLSTDFQIPMEELEKDSMEELLKFEKLVGIAVKPLKVVEEESQPVLEQDYLDETAKLVKEMETRYKLRI